MAGIRLGSAADVFSYSLDFILFGSLDPFLHLHNPAMQSEPHVSS
jgi:hypothetical protein